MTASGAALPISRTRRLRDRGSVRRVRLWSGLALFAYLLSHFTNHALGNISLDAMQDGFQVFLAIWANPVGQLVLYGATTAHMVCAFWALYEKRHFGWTAGELTQLVLGFAIPLLLVQHVVGTRVAHILYGISHDYRSELHVLFLTDPWRGFSQCVVLLVAWSHGCIGLHYWLRLKPFYPKARSYLFGAALLVPTVAILGFVQGGRAVAYMAESEEWVTALQQRFTNLDMVAADRLLDLSHDLQQGYVALILATIGARGIRSLIERRRGIVRVRYPSGQIVSVTPGMSVLEASRIGKIPHAAVCGGRGRCSTCRVRILAGTDGLPPPVPSEASVLRRLTADPSIRLACMLRPRRDLTVVPLLTPDPSTRAAGAAQPINRAGSEQPVTIMFVDIRASTRIVESRLPYDAVFIFNRFFEVVGSSVTEAGGLPNQFLGDGVMALFGVDSSAGDGARAALRAANSIAVRLEELNRVLVHDLPDPLRIGIGIHTGTAIVGEMGYREFLTTTAVGDPVHVAARLQDLTKTYSCMLVMSDDTSRAAGVDPDAFRHEETSVRGRTEPLGIRVVPDARELSLPA